MKLDTLYCALCGSGLTRTQGIDEDGVKWTRHRCDCGRTEFLHLDYGVLDLGLLPPVADNDFEILA